MQANPLSPRQALNKAFLKVKPNRSNIELFKSNFNQLLGRIDLEEHEEHLKNDVADFLKNSWYSPHYYINTKGRTDLVIHTGKEGKNPVGVIIEAKKPENKAEMLRPERLNVKALHELILYYLRERITGKNLEIKHLIATNIWEWYIFDAVVFEKVFAGNKALVKQFQDFEEGRLAGKTTDFFYKEIAEPFVAALAEPLTYTWLDIRTYEKPLRNQRKDDDIKLIPLYKILSPEHLLKLPFQNDSNSLDRGFYAEFLHLIGLSESKEGGKKVIGRLPEGERQKGSLLELTIVQLDAHDEIYNIPNAGRFGETYAERLYNVALELCITWINRILFLKLLEAQLLNYHKGSKEYSFLSLDKVLDFDALDSLFFRVLARKPAERADELNRLFAHVPYLNSSLFEATELERQTIYVSNLADDAALPLLPATVVKDVNGKKRKGTLGTMAYLFSFLDAYDFSSEGSEDIQEENKALINASVLGLIFEKINGYKDGSFFTPGFITMYMCREALRRAVVQKFCEAKGWKCNRFEQLYDKIEDKQEANSIINSLKICDPAVGSGHFLVSALNEIIAIKSELKILLDREGRTLRDYHVEVVNDELVVLDEEGKSFAYKPHSKESQRVQEALFHEKQLIIENCLFGVDINPNSVKICRLRLWIELLKNAYYQQRMPMEGAEAASLQTASPICYAGEFEKGSAEMRPEFREAGSAGELQTLPNIDINIKQGNSLISRFALDADLGKALKKSKWNIESYKIAVQSYRHARNKEEKRELEGLINDIKGNFRSEINKNDKKVLRLNRLRGEHYNLVNQGLLFGGSKSEEKARKKKQKELEKEIEKLDGQIEEIRNNKIFEGAFEWRFEFPEVLDDEGEFRGFDAIIGNPPYVSRNFAEQEKLFFNNNYEVAEYQLDLYTLFIELGNKVLHEKGLIGFITPNSWLKNLRMQRCRAYFLSKLKMHKIVPKIANAFEEASVDTLIFIADKFGEKKIGVYELNNILDFTFKRTIEQSRFWENDGLVFDVEVDDATRILLKKIRKSSGTLESMFTITRGVNPYDKYTGQSQEVIKGKAYHSDHKKNETFVPELRGKHVGTLNYNWDKKSYISYGEWLAAPREPIFFEGKRILFREVISERFIVCPIVEDFVLDRSLYVAKPKNEKVDIYFYCGILASRLLVWLFKFEKNEFDDLFPKIRVGEFKGLPIPLKFNNEIGNRLGDLVVEIQKNKFLGVKTSPQEKELDQLVYQLYGLSEEEIQLVEESVR